MVGFTAAAASASSPPPPPRFLANGKIAEQVEMASAASEGIQEEDEFTAEKKKEERTCLPPQGRRRLPRWWRRRPTPLPYLADMHNAKLRNRRTGADSHKVITRVVVSESGAAAAKKVSNDATRLTLTHVTA